MLIQRIYSLIKSFSSSRYSRKTFGSDPKLPPQSYKLDVRDIVDTKNDSDHRNSLEGTFKYFLLHSFVSLKWKYVNGKTGERIVNSKNIIPLKAQCNVCIDHFISETWVGWLVMWTTGPDMRLYQSIHYTRVTLHLTAASVRLCHDHSPSSQQK